MRKNAKDRIGEQHGLLEIRDWKREGDRTYFYCRCECGNEKWIRADLVIDGTTTSCGCRAAETQFKPVDLTSQIFGRLKAIRPTEKRDKHNGSVIWLCECRCGNRVEVAEGRLIKEEVRSCGCLAKEIQRQSIKKANQKRAEAFLVEGTDLLILKREKPIKSNKSGVTGVSFDNSKQKWFAQIGFQGKNISLGSFSTMEEAVKARKDGEALYFEPVLKKYEQEEAPLKGKQQTDHENPARPGKYTQQELLKESPDSALVIKTKEEQCREAFLKWVSEQEGPITSTKYDQDSRGNPALPTLRKIWRALGVSSWNELLNTLEITQDRKEGQRKSVIKIP